MHDDEDSEIGDCQFVFVFAANLFAVVLAVLAGPAHHTQLARGSASQTWSTTS